MKARLRRLGEKYRWLGTTLDVQERYQECEGAVVAQSLTLTLFLSIFPLILVVTAVIGFITNGDPNVTGDLVSRFGLTGTAAETFRTAVSTAQHSRRSATLVGFAGLLLAALGIITGMKRAINRPWQIRGRGFRDYGGGVVWLVGGGVLLAVSSAGVGIALGILGTFGHFVAPILAAGVNTLFFWFTFMILGSVSVGARPLRPGAIAAGIGFELLTLVGTYYVPRTVASSSALYGSIGVVFAILAFLFLFARLVVYSSTLNVVLYEREKGTQTVPIEAPVLPGADVESADRAGIVQTASS